MPRHGDRDPLITNNMIITWNVYNVNSAGFLPFITLHLNDILCFYDTRCRKRFCVFTVFVSLSQDVRPSVREGDLEAKAVLEMAGRTLHSEGMDGNVNEMWHKDTNDEKE